MRFTKMHGLGNDYVYVDCLQSELESPSRVAQIVADRHFGVGGDGLVLIRPSETADFRMQMYNADGSESEMCGNAIRCVAKYVYDEGYTSQTTISIETLAGIKPIDVSVQDGEVVLARVNMGAPVLNGPDIPVAVEQNPVVGAPVTVDGQELRFTAVSMGNPHAVFFVDAISDTQVLELGPRLEVDPLFPRRMNIEFVRVLNDSEIEMRVWERGTGETLACGTGACAVAVAAHLNGYTGRLVKVHLLGGTLDIEVAEDTVYMTGPAVRVFDGELDLDRLLRSGG